MSLSFYNLSRFYFVTTFGSARDPGFECFQCSPCSSNMILAEQCLVSPNTWHVFPFRDVPPVRNYNWEARPLFTPSLMTMKLLLPAASIGSGIFFTTSCIRKFSRFCSFLLQFWPRYTLILHNICVCKFVERWIFSCFTWCVGRCLPHFSHFHQRSPTTVWPFYIIYHLGSLSSLTKPNTLCDSYDQWIYSGHCLVSKHMYKSAK